MNWLAYSFYGNSLQNWAIALAVAVFTWVFLRVLKGVFTGRFEKLAKKTANKTDDLVLLLVQATKGLLLFLVGMYVGSLVLDLSEKATSIVESIIIVAVLIQATVWGNAAITFIITQQREKYLETDSTKVMTAGVLSFIGRFALYSIVLLLILDNLGVNVTALVASLGIGGIAVALALQNILSDLFASLSISLDKPFVIGDFIIVGDLLGVVERVGLKTTRIRSLSGEQLIFSNTDLLNSRIRNFKRMFERRVVFGFGVIYQTSYDQLKMIPSIVREAVESQEKTRFDRAHFKAYGSSSLDFEVVYYVQTPDYNVYMDIQQAINLSLYKRFEEEGIDFAYPTQTVYLKHEGGASVEGAG